MSLLENRYRFDGTPQQVLGRLRQAQADDKIAEKRALHLGVLGFLAFLGLVAFLAMQIHALAGVAVVLMLALWWGALWYKRRDVDDHKLAVPVRFLDIARADMPPDTVLGLTLDLAGYDKPGYHVSGDAYRQKWLTLDAKLSDGNRLGLEVEWLVKRRTKAKHRGTRVKERSRDRVTLALRLNPRLYPSPQRVAEALRAGPPPGPLKVAGVRPGEHDLAISLATAPRLRVGTGLRCRAQDAVQITGDTLLGTLVWLYRGIKVAKAATLPSPQAPPF